MIPADTTREIDALIAEAFEEERAGFVSVPQCASLAWHWPQVIPLKEQEQSE